MNARPLRTILCLFILAVSACQAQVLPQLLKENGRFTLAIDGRPFLPLGAQVGNSSGWPDKLSQLWPRAEAMHVNTLEVPVYWEQMEPREGSFDDSVVDDVLAQARAHKVHLVLLWFGTWKNGKMHYVPGWVKQDGARFPRMFTAEGKPIDVLSANSPANLEADRKAFLHLMHHLKQVDGSQHTVFLVQVENESGALGSVRDFSPMAQKQFDAAVPVTLTRALGKSDGTWKQVFGDDADETFQAWSVASYIDAVAAAGKRELPLPMYVNNWLKSPRGFPILTVPGEDYPSGGPTANMLSVWKAAAPSIDILAPDIYVPNTQLYRNVMEGFKRPDNPLLIPETHGFGTFPGSQGAARNLFLALGAGAIGYAPFGLDSFRSEVDGKPDLEQIGMAENYRLLTPLAPVLAQLQFQAKLKAAVEEPGLSAAELTFGSWSAQVTFPPSYTESADTSGLGSTAALHMGRVLVAPIGPGEFLVAGIDCRVAFRRTPSGSSKQQTEFLRVEQGTYESTVWHAGRIWNGDETDAGINFKNPGDFVHVKLNTY